MYHVSTGGGRMKTIITVQHTQSVHHTNGMVGSWTDWELTEKGVFQAENIGKKLAQEYSGRRFVMYSSDLKRANQTADAIAHQMGITPVLRRELRERNLGRCCGKSVQWLRENKERDEVTIDDRLFSDGESRRDEWNRLKPFFDEIMSTDEENIIIVSHGGILSSFNVMFLGLDVESLGSVYIHGMAGGVSLFIVEDSGRRKVLKISDMSYVN